MLSNERLVGDTELSREELLGGPALFHRRVLRWFALLWAALLASALWLGGTDIRVQVSWNLVVLFLGATAIMIRMYRLDSRHVLALRMPRRRVWLAVLIGAPSAYITGIGIGRLAGLLFPVPERVLEAFGQYLLPEGMPLWQVLFFLALLPGIAEEILFRGMLLHGLRPKLRPVALCLAVGAIFGLFHADLFRIIPTAYLGAILAAVVILSGSIFPAMLWHAINNAVALVPAWYGVEVREPEWWLYGLGALGVMVAFGLLWRWREPRLGSNGN
ncbi:MAG: lysostaphin resistance A-like protein [Longimicrobiales bacterium]